MRGALGAVVQDSLQGLIKDIVLACEGACCSQDAEALLPCAIDVASGRIPMPPWPIMALGAQRRCKGLWLQCQSCCTERRMLPQKGTLAAYQLLYLKTAGSGLQWSISKAEDGFK